jgi:hypothetical protein
VIDVCDEFVHGAITVALGERAEARRIAMYAMALNGSDYQRGGEQGHGQKQGVVAPTGSSCKHVKIS